MNKKKQLVLYNSLIEKILSIVSDISRIHSFYLRETNNFINAEVDIRRLAVLQGKSYSFKENFNEATEGISTLYLERSLIQSAESAQDLIDYLFKNLPKEEEEL